MNRSWLKDIPGYEGRYAVDMGGNVFGYKRGKYLKPYPAVKSGHLLVALGGTNKRYVHELVLTTFLGPRPSPKHVGRHLNGDRLHNCVLNLHWGTQSQNMLDIKWYNPDSKRHKLTIDQVRNIRRLLDEGVPQIQIAKKFGVHQTTISDINVGRSYYDVPAAL